MKIEFPEWMIDYRVTLAYSLGALVTLALLVLLALDQQAQEQLDQAEAHHAQAVYLILEAERTASRGQPAPAAAGSSKAAQNGHGAAPRAAAAQSAQEGK